MEERIHGGVDFTLIQQKWGGKLQTGQLFLVGKAFAVDTKWKYYEQSMIGAIMIYHITIFIYCRLT